MADDELKPAQPLSPGLPTDLPPEDRRRPLPKQPPEKPADENTESDNKRSPPENLIDEYV